MTMRMIQEPGSRVGGRQRQTNYDLKSVVDRQRRTGDLQSVRF